MFIPETTMSSPSNVVLKTQLPDCYPDVVHLREECNDVLENVLSLSETIHLKKYVNSKDDIIKLAHVLYDHVYENMHNSQFYKASK